MEEVSSLKKSVERYIGMKLWIDHYTFGRSHKINIKN